MWRTYHGRDGPRTFGVRVAQPHQHHLAAGDLDLYCDNRVITSKYTLLTFLPINLFEQFQRIANFYFLIPGVAIIEPITSVLPLLFVIGVTAIKQAYEDYKRHQADAVINLSECKTLQADGTLAPCYYKDIVCVPRRGLDATYIYHGHDRGRLIANLLLVQQAVGDIVQVCNEQEIPCDLVVVASALESRDCYITTANLDGESTLKVRYCPKLSQGWGPAELARQDKLTVEAGVPNAILYDFDGRIRSGETVEALTTKNVLLKGARLKGTPWVLGIAVYTGDDSKLALNQPKTKYKFSTAESRLNIFLAFYFLWLILVCTISTVYGEEWRSDARRFWPLRGQDTQIATDLTYRVGDVIVTWLRFMLLYNWVIPISLYVTLELQKLAGSLLINWDLKLYDEHLDEPATARTSDLIEDLGQVEHVFADKTGTLTENRMVFKKCNVRGHAFEVQGDYERLVPAGSEKTRASLNSAAGPSALNTAPSDVWHDTSSIREMFMCLALCHTVSYEDSVDESAQHTFTRQRKMTSVSPDEEALVRAAALPEVGIHFFDRSDDTIQLEIDGQRIEYELLHIMEFSSARMRMSVLVRDPNGQATLYTKGADAAVMQRCRAQSSPQSTTEEQQAELHQLQEQLDEYSRQGLRTLAVAARQLSADELEHAIELLTEASQAMEDRKGKLRDAYETLERDLDLIGVTAVEDRLQDGVPETMIALREAGIRTWVLTGDKVQTAINISLSAGHFSHSATQLKLLGLREADACGQALKELLPQPSSTTLNCSVRLPPSVSDEDGNSVQGGGKAVAGRKPVTLAIGDGANDVAMIREAHVGVGILGKEGRQAARSSDYSIGQFRFLKPLLLVHGHYCYWRIAYTIQFFFYKNLAYILPCLFYGPISLFSAQVIYEQWNLTFWNLFFTSLPVLCFGIFEKDIDERVLLRTPRIYPEFVGNAVLSYRKFFEWTITGVWQGTAAYYGVTLALERHRPTVTLWWYGMTIYSLMLLLVTLRIAFDMRYWTWMSHVCVWGSLLAYVAFNLVESGILFVWGEESSTGGYYWVFYDMLGSEIFWGTLVGMAGIAILPHYLFSLYMRFFRPTLLQQCQASEWEQLRAMLGVFTCDCCVPGLYGVVKNSDYV
ncbi:uncharacterized protein MONBRDRAFT_26477 [Monosiga brevicollis MX1]|uniref:Phospholipid-transporting ATPase n=1 Tax=Monosiga brevicollis TaxID=81824 RepID=A9V2H2_MONBE|nr:uncharacterized protein MONBRDRAFT_26477 [Monosiga brevicollis MX1]EDQ88256.1 predicted protein [Monosiga brevicollis MX1]|eukprot:XP_001746849.1 hypothetical protein [Monosiga brevicollis MX1]